MTCLLQPGEIKAVKINDIASFVTQYKMTQQLGLHICYITNRKLYQMNSLLKPFLFYYIFAHKAAYGDWREHSWIQSQVRPYCSETGKVPRRSADATVHLPITG